MRDFLHSIPKLVGKLLRYSGISTNVSPIHTHYFVFSLIPIIAYPQMTFVPLLYPLVSLFLHFHCPQDVYRSIVALVRTFPLFPNRSRINPFSLPQHTQLSSKHHRFISINRSDRSIDGFILVKLTNKFGIVKRNKLALSARAKLKNNQLDTAFADWIQCKCATYTMQ